MDLLNHDAQFAAGEEAVAAEHGHATVDRAVTFALEADAHELMLFHRSPTRTDGQLDRVVAALVGSAVTVSVAIEGADRDLPSPGATVSV